MNTDNDETIYNDDNAESHNECVHDCMQDNSTSQNVPAMPVIKDYTDYIVDKGNRADEKSCKERSSDNISQTNSEWYMSKPIMTPSQMSKQSVTEYTPYNTDSSYNTSYNQYNNSQPVAKKKHSVFFILLIVILSLLVVTIIIGIVNPDTDGNGILDKTGNNTTINIPVQKKPKLDKEYYDENTGLYTTEGIAKRVLPSVVSIEIYGKESKYAPIAQGSGIIMTSNGYIITNAHVIEGATSGINVVLNNKTTYSATLVGMDKKTDLAVIKVNAKKLVAADFGDSDELILGEEVVAIGSPAGLYGSITKGIVSGLDRRIKTDKNNQLMSCIQIDAAVNPGNSGGALVNMYGQVVGINSSKLLEKGYDGIGFAISMKDAKPIVEKLMKDGKITGRIRVGITFNEITDFIAEKNNMTPGLRIISIDETCDIAKTDLKAEDIIEKVNGKEVRTRDDLIEVLKDAKPGDEVTADVVRESEGADPLKFTIKFKLMEDTTMDIPTSDEDK